MNKPNLFIFFIMSLFLFLVSVYARKLLIAFIFLIVAYSIMVYNSQEKRLRQCKRNLETIKANIKR